MNGAEARKSARPRRTRRSFLCAPTRKSERFFVTSHLAAMPGSLPAKCSPQQTRYRVWRLLTPERTSHSDEGSRYGQSLLETILAKMYNKMATGIGGDLLIMLLLMDSTGRVFWWEVTSVIALSSIAVSVRGIVEFYVYFRGLVGLVGGQRDEDVTA